MTFDNNINTSPGNLSLIRDSLHKLYQRKEEKNEALKDPFHHLFKDLTRKSDLGFSFKEPLGTEKFTKAEKYAESCIELSVRATEIKSSILPGWVNGSLNCFDIPILHYIQETLNEKVPQYSNANGKLLGIERSVYRFLQLRGNDDENNLGKYFEIIYQAVRNPQQHTKVRDKQGVIRINEPPSNNQLKIKILKWFRAGLNPMLRLYKKTNY